MTKSKINLIHKDLTRLIGRAAVLSDDLSLVAYGADAGCYRKIPQIVLKPNNEQDVILILEKLCNEKIPVTFRAAGTSLSGQSISDSVLLQARGDNWQKVRVLDHGKSIQTQPGITGSRVNQILKPYNVKFGPDPASINSALIGGILANNSSGMSCGIHANAYATIESARIILSDGTLLDTANESSREEFKKSKPELVRTIEGLRSKIKSKPENIQFIKNKYSIKNTTGYGLNSFIDYDDPIDILLHLMVGSEGTLGFISEATFSTIPLLNYRASSMVYFNNLEDACNAVPELKKAGVQAIELMDREALRSIEDKPGIPDFIKSFGKQVTALLIDLEAESDQALQKLIHDTQSAIRSFKLKRDFEITRDIKQINEFWKIRKGVFPSVGGMREPGTTVIIEDIAVSLEHLSSAVLDLREMLDNLGYKNAVIYGHALDGNLHFIFAQDFDSDSELKKYEELINKLTQLIVQKYNGSLKAEHGTGINMAPFVAYEWGEDLYAVMKDIKSAFDPLHILNPGVIINDDPKVYLKNFKHLPEVDESVDKCIECGFCESNCLSSGYTLSARQRIVIQREIQYLTSENKDFNIISILRDSFKFAGDQSCAADGLCSTDCPLDIDTGVLIKRLRNQVNASNPRGTRWALRIANRFGTTKKIIRRGLGFVSFAQTVFGNSLFLFISNSIRKLTFNHIPSWHIYMPQPARNRRIQTKTGNDKQLKVVYFPSCINQTMGPSKSDNQQDSLVQVTVNVLEKAGYRVIFPEHMEKLCCGTPWESKGFFNIADAKSSELETELLKASENGKYPVLCDTSPCIYRMRRVMSPKLIMYEPVEFICDFLLDKLSLNKTQEKVAFHVTCSSTKMGLNEKFLKVAQTCTDQFVFPEEVGCCGFAGDKGFSQPALNDWALRHLKAQVSDCESGYSNSRTCEIGLSRNSGINYRSIMYLINKAAK